MIDRDAPADLVLVDGAVMTMDGARHHAQAVAVRDGRIAAIGSSDEVDALRGPRTRRIDLAGRTLLPSFQDAHVHPVMAGINLTRCPLHDLEPTASVYLETIREYALANPERPWVIGDGWYMSAFPGGTPTRQALDAVVPDRPAFFVNRDGHGAWLNSRALELAGIDRTSPDPSSGRIEREPDGAPSGTLHEGAMEIVRQILPPATTDDLARGLELAQAYLHRLGISAWQDAWVTAEDLAAYRLIAERGPLTGRAIACHWWERDRGGEQIDELIERRRTGTIGRLRSDHGQDHDRRRGRELHRGHARAVPRRRRAPDRQPRNQLRRSRAPEALRHPARCSRLPGPLPRAGRPRGPRIA